MVGATIISNIMAAMHNSRKIIFIILQYFLTSKSLIFFLGISLSMYSLRFLPTTHVVWGEVMFSQASGEVMFSQASVILFRMKGGQSTLDC